MKIYIDPYISDKNVADYSSFWKYKVYTDTRGDFSWRGPQMRVGLSATAIFGDLSSYFFGNFRDKASYIIMTILCYPLLACD